MNVNAGAIHVSRSGVVTRNGEMLGRVVRSGRAWSNGDGIAYRTQSAAAIALGTTDNRGPRKDEGR